MKTQQISDNEKLSTSSCFRSVIILLQAFSKEVAFVAPCSAKSNYSVKQPIAAVNCWVGICPSNAS